MNSLRIKRKDIYEIEVNDQGETIQFDLTDIDLPFRLQRAFEAARKAQNELKAEMVIIQKKEDHKGADSLLSDRELEAAQARSEAFAKMRSAMDKFLGEGACQKIFGDTNYLEMFDDLFEALSAPGEDGKSHLERMAITADGIKARIIGKYGAQDDGILR